MLARRAVLLLVLLGLVAGCGDDGGGGESSASSDENPIVRKLRDGGLTLVIRHATADAEIAKQEKLSSCALQRNLTEAGKEQAKAIGDGVRKLKIPIGDVRASPMCRTHDTAEIAFGRVTDDRDLISPGVIGTEADDKRRAAALKAMVEKPPPAGKNTVLVTHTGNIGSGLGEETVAEAEMLVYGAGGKLVGRIKAEEWAGLAGTGSKPAPAGGY